MRQIWRWLVGSWLAVLALGLWQWPDNQVRLIACEVGQGDALLITQGFNQVLVDGGPNNGKVLGCLGEYMPFWDRRIEMVVATHPEMDHIGGLVEVFGRFKVDTVLLSDAGKETEIFRNLYETIQESGANLRIADRGMRVEIGEMNFEVLSPDKDDRLVAQWYQNRLFIDQKILGLSEGIGKTEVNGRGIVMVLNAASKKVLLSADIGVEEEKELMALGLVPDVDILKVAHHGSKTSTSEEWLSVSKPEVTLISVGKNNSYKHPAFETVERLERAGVTIWRTDEAGDITVNLSASGMKVSN